MLMLLISICIMFSMMHIMLVMLTTDLYESNLTFAVGRFCQSLRTLRRCCGGPPSAAACSCKRFRQRRAKSDVAWGGGGAGPSSKNAWPGSSLR